MDVFDLQASLRIDTTPYIEALRRAAAETERLRTQMSTPITTPLSTTGGGSGGGSSGGGSGGSGTGGSGLSGVTSDAEAAGKAIDELNQKIGKGFSAAVKIMTASWATATTALAAGTKKAVESFAQYEQLVGGVDTIFKESSQKVQKYAEDAYKTAGMSANQYMETVTSFSMSLLQGLAGDTEKAADMADIAISDMSDNANKMGTAMESIEHAYQGFAKQNYTMLDNLKLGYGGTKAEMERLLEDAEKLSGMKFEITNYSDIIQAIHVIQEDLDITGTTAKEAADTIEGSFNSTKAALENLYVGFARSDADIDKLMGDVEDNISNLAKNVIPVAEKAFVSLMKAGIKAGKEIAEKLPKLIRQTMTEIHKMIAQSFGDSKDAIFAVETTIKSLTAAFITFKATAYLADVVDSIKKVNTALQAGVTLTEALNKANLANPWVIAATAAVGLATALKSVIDIQTDLIEEAVNGLDRLDDAQKEVYDSMSDLLTITTESRKAWKEQSDTLESNASLYSSLADELFRLDAQEQLSNEDKVRMKAIVDDLNGSIEGLNISLNAQNGHLETQKKDIEDVIKAYNDQAKATATQERLVKLYEQQYQLEDKYKKAYNERAKALKEYNILKGKQIEAEKKFQAEERKWQESNGTENYNEMLAAEEELKKINGELEKASDRSAAFAEKYSALGDEVRANTDEINKNVESLTNMGQASDEASMKIVDSMGQIAGAIIDSVDAYAQLQDSTEGVWLTIRDKTTVLSLETAQEVGKLIDAYDELFEAQYQSIAKSVDLYNGFEADTSRTYNDLLKNLKQSEHYLNDWTNAIDELQAKVDKGLMSQDFLDSLKDMGLDSWNIVYNMNHATEGQLKEYSDLWDKANREIAESTQKLTKRQREETENRISELTGIANASIEDYEKAFTDAGVAIGEGLEKGIQQSIKDAQAAIKEGEEGVIQIGRETLKVNSPSGEFKEIGNYIVEGLVLGINEDMSLAEEAARELAQRTIKTMKEEMQISSPSKVTRELGAYTSEGFAMGIEDNADKVYAAAEGLSENTLDPFRELSDKIDALTSKLKAKKKTNSIDDEGGTVSTIDPQALAEAIKEGLQDLVSGDVLIDFVIDGEKFAYAIFPKIDVIQGKKLETAARGYSTT